MQFLLILIVFARMLATGELVHKKIKVKQNVNGYDFGGLAMEPLNPPKFSPTNIV